VKGNPGADISLLLPENHRGSHQFNISIRRKSLYKQIHYGRTWDLGQVYLEQELAIEILLHRPSLFKFPGRYLKIPSLPGVELQNPE
jgi:hypothetical protein